MYEALKKGKNFMVRIHKSVKHVESLVDPKNGLVVYPFNLGCFTPRGSLIALLILERNFYPSLHRLC